MKMFVLPFCCCRLFLQPASSLKADVQTFMLSCVPAAGKAAVLMHRAQALKAARARSKAAAKAAKAAAAAAAAGGGSSSSSPDVIATNPTNSSELVNVNPEVDVLTRVHQRALTAVATLIQVSLS